MNAPLAPCVSRREGTPGERFSVGRSEDSQGRWGSRAAVAEALEDPRNSPQKLLSGRVRITEDNSKRTAGRERTRNVASISVKELEPVDTDLSTGKGLHREAMSH